MDRKEYNRKYNELNKEEIKEYKRSWYQKNKETVKAKAKEYYINNRESILEKQRLYLLEKYGDDMNSKIKKNVLRSIEIGLSSGYWDNKIETLLGYSVNTLQNKLGKINEKWHIHHIIPVRVYNFYNEEDIKKCWSLENIITLPNSERNNDIDWDLIEENKLEHLLPDTLMMEDLIGRHHEV